MSQQRRDSCAVTKKTCRSHVGSRPRSLESTFLERGKNLLEVKERRGNLSGGQRREMLDKSPEVTFLMLVLTLPIIPIAPSRADCCL